jgi:hypothetical protein
MDSKPTQDSMIPLYSTASFLVQENMSIDRGVAMLKIKSVVKPSTDDACGKTMG